MGSVGALARIGRVRVLDSSPVTMSRHRHRSVTVLKGWEICMVTAGGADHGATPRGRSEAHEREVLVRTDPTAERTVVVRLDGG